jgi:uncharacterized protein (UPF0264 family)
VVAGANYLSTGIYECNGMAEECEVCGKVLCVREVKDSEEFIGGGRYFCRKHLEQKMDW